MASASPIVPVRVSFLHPRSASTTSLPAPSRGHHLAGAIPPLLIRDSRGREHARVGSGNRAHGALLCAVLGPWWRAADARAEPTWSPGSATDGNCPHGPMRSEEHTAELQSRFDLVCR